MTVRVVRRALRPLALAAVLLVTACADPPSDPGRATLVDESRRLEPVNDTAFDEAVAPFRYHSALEASERRVIRDADSWGEFWVRTTARMSSPSPAPAVDFGRHMVVVAALGTRPSGGYSIVLEGVFEGDTELLVPVLAVSPGEACFTTAALTAPLDLMLVERRDLPARFTQRDETLDCR